MRAQAQQAQAARELSRLKPLAEKRAVGQKEADDAFDFRREHGFDFRFYGLPFPKSAWEKKVLRDYATKYHEAFPPPYPASQSEVDQLNEIEGVKVVCDPKSFLYLNNTQIDFEDNLMGRGFKFGNPNAAKSCGCGESFRV